VVIGALAEKSLRWMREPVTVISSSGAFSSAAGCAAARWAGTMASAEAKIAPLDAARIDGLKALACFPLAAQIIRSDSATANGKTPARGRRHASLTVAFI
jgi:hypothetical protein